MLVLDRFPEPSETFIVQRFLGLLERGWDMHVLCDRVGDISWFGGLRSVPDVEKRIHRPLPVRPRFLALALWPYVALRALVRSPRGLLRYLIRGWRREGAHILRRLSYDAAFVALAPDIVHFKFGWAGNGREHLGDLLGSKLIVSFQGADLNYAGLDEDPGYYAGIWRAADATHFLSDDLRARAIRRGYTPDDRTVVIIPGVNLDRFAPRVRSRSDGEPLRILSVGRLHWKKGYDYALQGLRRLLDEGIDFSYRIVGDGPDRDAVLFTRSDLGLDARVELLGAQSLDAVITHMQWADVLLHSAISEGFCYAVVEAQAMELPVVTSDADGLGQNVADGETGFVVPRRDPAALAERLAPLARDQELRVRMGRQGRSRALSTFVASREIDDFERLYRNVLERA